MATKYKLPPGYEPIETVPRGETVLLIYPSGAIGTDEIDSRFLATSQTHAVGWKRYKALQKIERWTWEWDEDQEHINILQRGQFEHFFYTKRYGSRANAEAIAQAICDTANGFEEAKV